MKNLIVNNIAKLTGIILLTGFAQFAIAQETVQPHFQPAIGTQSVLHPDTRSPLSTSLNLGFGLSSQFSGNTMTYQQINPTIRYQLNDRFSLFGGIAYTSFQNLDTYYISSTENSFETTTSNFNLGRIFMGGSYMVNPKLRLDGMVWKQQTMNTDSRVLMNNKPNFDAQGLNLRLNYQLSDKVQINAAFNYSKGYDPFYNPGMYNPFMPVGSSSPFFFHDENPFNR